MRIGTTVALLHYNDRLDRYINITLYIITI